MSEKVAGTSQDTTGLFRFFNEIAIVAQLSGSAFEKAMPEGMTFPQFAVLNHLMRVGGQRTPVQIASAMQVTKGTMTNTLQHLDRAGFVSTTPDATDGRSKRIDITEAGRSMHRDAIASIAPLLTDLAAIFPSKRVAEALHLLEDVRKELDGRRG
jgi:DNA-binding MarR family transcriptional regulator